MRKIKKGKLIDDTGLTLIEIRSPRNIGYCFYRFHVDISTNDHL